MTIMKRCFVAGLIWLLWVQVARAAGPAEEYVRIYTQMQAAGRMEEVDDKAQALAAYLDAREDLTRLKRSQPDWNPKVVDYRLRYLDERIEALTPKAMVVPEVAPASVPTAPAGPSEVHAQLLQLQTELERVQGENRLLQAKLREALTVLPAAVDPNELEKAEERQRALTAEVTSLRQQLAEAQTQSGQNTNVQALQNTQADLAAARQSLAESDEAALALLAENQLLKEQLAGFRNQVDESQTARGQLDQALAELAVLRSESGILKLEKAALEQRLQANSASPREFAEARNQIASLERERDGLQRELAQVNETLAQRSMVVIGEPTGINSAQVGQLEARLAVYEAEKIPYSVEEMALFRLSQSAPNNGGASARPTEPSPQLLEAEFHFRRGELPEAESAFKEAVQRGDTNAFALANLAATQVEQGKFTEAEANLNRALVLAPNDPFALATLGLLRFQQGNYDQALDSLSLAAQYNPGNAKIQNYLGVTLSQKGMRGPAENALRKAIQLEPGFAQPHYNLALVYVLQDPPLYQLARWHYQKALEGGHDRNTQVEQLLEKAAAQQATQ